MDIVIKILGFFVFVYLIFFFCSMVVVERLLENFFFLYISFDDFGINRK